MRRAAFWLGAAAGLLTLVTVVLREQPAEAISEIAHSASPTTARFGPGQWHEAAQAFVPPAPASDTRPPSAPFFNSDGSLRLDRALRDLFDHFLLGGHPGSRAQHVAALRSYLENLLDPASLARVWPLAERYLAYLDEHDRLLSAAAPAPVLADSVAAPMELDRVRAWLAQRTRLRQTVLGIEVARAWFEDEERELLALLDDLDAGRERQVSAEQGLDRTRSILREMQDTSAPLSSRRDYIAQHHGEEAAQRYEAMEREEQVWQQRFAAYREQAQLLRASTVLSEADRAREVEALRARVFPDEAQRLRATALDS